MAARNMTSFVGQNANHLIGVVRRNQQSRIQKDALAVGDKGVYCWILN